MEAENITEFQEYKPKTLQIGIGVAVALGTITAIGFYIRKRRRRRPELTLVDFDPAYVDQIAAYAQRDIAATEEVIVGQTLITDTKGISVLPNTDYNGITRVTPPISASAWHNPPVVEEVETAVTVNVFAEGPAEWNMELELQRRHSNLPYVISLEEFMGEEMGFKQVQVTYYERDDTMVDSYDTIVHGHHALCGKLEFGHGSEQPDVVYVRNELNEIEYEVVRNDGAYSQEVLGQRMQDEIDVELRHSHSGPQRMRRSD